MNDDKHSFMDQLNLFLVGLVVGAFIGACFSANVVKGKNIKTENNRGLRAGAAPFQIRQNCLNIPPYSVKM